MSMLNVTATRALGPAGRPPIVLIHGAANSSRVWAYWQTELASAGWSSFAVDLRGHGGSVPVDLAGVGMRDYVADVLSVAARLAERPVLVGWSMGGLVALMAAAPAGAVACVCLAPSAPAKATDPSVPLRSAVFGPEAYGITSRAPGAQPAMPGLDRDERMVALDSLCDESQYARDERRAGIVVDSIGCPLLIVTGTNDDQWPRSRYDGLCLPADFLEADGASHWGLVLSRRALARVVPAVVRWLGAKGAIA